MHSFFHRTTGIGRQLIIGLFSLVVCCLTYYFHAILEVGTIISHFYYIPIVLSCLWWQRKGLWVAVILIVFLLVSHQLVRSDTTSYSDYIRIFMLMSMAIVVAELSEKISRKERQLKNAYDQLETRVEERTAQLVDANRKLELEIDQHKRAEERLGLSTKMLEQRNEEIKNFAYIVSHDLRAPLINLKGFSAELRHALGDIHPILQAYVKQLDRKLQADVDASVQDIAEALEFIASSTSRMDSLINALLQLSRLGRFEIKPERIDMEEKVQETLNTLAHQIAEKQIEVQIGPLPIVEADKLAMQQILSNLLNNAILYSNPGRKGQIEITSQTGLDQVTFCVKDNGRGIAPEDMDKIFMPFRRAGNTTVPGEGMGLAYAQALVRRHGGHIQCTSKIGEGTTFSFTIPVSSSKDEV